VNQNKRIYIGECAEKLGRKAHTVRVWIYQDKLPKKLLPKRDERNWRYWTEEQVEGLKRWIVNESIYPGKGLKTVRDKRK
jgi:hypothetical protein